VVQEQVMEKPLGVAIRVLSPVQVPVSNQDLRVDRCHCSVVFPNVVLPI
jgi:hypothetical protein